MEWKCDSCVPIGSVACKLSTSDPVEAPIVHRCPFSSQVRANWQPAPAPQEAQIDKSKTYRIGSPHKYVEKQRTRPLSLFCRRCGGEVTKGEPHKCQCAEPFFPASSAGEVKP
jgi:hypothetical protein